MKPRKRHKLDKVWFGAVIGIICPIIGFFASYFIKAPDMSFDAFMSIFRTQVTARTDVLTMCLVANMFAFYFIFFRAQWYEASKSLVLITLILAAYVVYELIGF